MSAQSNEWPTELYDSDEWPDIIEKPDAIYFPPCSVYIDGKYAGETGESEIILKWKDETE